MADSIPDGPEPTTKTSQKSFACSYLSGSGSLEEDPIPAAFLIKCS